jgi:2-acylglycerol O-acyltransferase 1
MDADDDHPDGIPTKTKVILFATNAESGQANTILALALEASARPNVEVHVASFPALKRRVERFGSKLSFHPLDGVDLFETFAAHGFFERNISHPPTTKSFLAYQRVGIILAGWDGEGAFPSSSPSNVI